MIAERDMEHCRAAIRTGSLSFHAASKLLPQSVRDPALALYAFCRLADDEVDEGRNKTAAVLDLTDRLDLVYAGKPRNAPEDRAFCAVIEDFEMPRALPDALLEGLAWDAFERQYKTLSDLRAYSARVASAVGAMMCVLMRMREPNALARACDLGVAMQLTNIARDIGEDARAGRLYVPTDWLKDMEIPKADFLRSPAATPDIRRITRRLLSEANRLYIRSEAGIPSLPVSARAGIFAARYIYAAIGHSIRQNGYDSVSQRARTSKPHKLALIAKAGLRAGGTLVIPASPVLYARPLPEVAFLVDAASEGTSPLGEGRAAALLDILAELKARDITNGYAAE